MDECTLNCMNGGYCRHGKKDTSLIQSFGKELEGYDIADDDGYWQHCVCPGGYFGLQCEHEIEICGGGNAAGNSNLHVCLHGSECITVIDNINEGQTVSATRSGHSDTGTTYGCNCNAVSGNGPERYAGNYCQYKSTDICSQTGELSRSDAFCVNNGVCDDLIDSADGGGGEIDQM